jgi:hypothetical protein
MLAADASSRPEPRKVSQGADQVCGAGYRERSDGRVNRRNGCWPGMGRWRPPTPPVNRLTAGNNGSTSAGYASGRSRESAGHEASPHNTTIDFSNTL